MLLISGQGEFETGLFSYRCDVDRNVNNVLLHCLLADKMHSVCENVQFFMGCNTHSVLEVSRSLK